MKLRSSRSTPCWAHTASACSVQDQCTTVFLSLSAFLSVSLSLCPWVCTRGSLHLSVSRVCLSGLGLMHQSCAGQVFAWPWRQADCCQRAVVIQRDAPQRGTTRGWTRRSAASYLNRGWAAGHGRPVQATALACGVCRISRRGGCGLHNLREIERESETEGRGMQNAFVSLGLIRQRNRQRMTVEESLD